MNIYCVNHQDHFLKVWMSHFQTSLSFSCTTNTTGKPRNKLKYIDCGSFNFLDDQQICFGKDTNANLRALGFIVFQFYSKFSQRIKSNLIDEAYQNIFLEPSLFSLVYNCSYLENLGLLEKKKYIEEAIMSISTPQNRKNDEDFPSKINVCGQIMSWILRYFLFNTHIKSQILNYSYQLAPKQIYEFICEFLNINYSCSEDRFFFEDQGLYIKCQDMRQYSVGRIKKQRREMLKNQGRNRYFNLQIGLNFNAQSQLKADSDHQIATPTFAQENKENKKEYDATPQKKSEKQKLKNEVSSLLELNPHECQSEDEDKQINQQKSKDIHSLNESFVIYVSSQKEKVNFQTLIGQKEASKKVNSQLHFSDRLYSSRNSDRKLRKKQSKQFLTPESNYQHAKEIKQYLSPETHKKRPQFLYRSNYTAKSNEEKSRQQLEEKFNRNFPEFMQKKQKLAEREKEFDPSEIFRTQTLMKPKLYFKTDNQKLNNTKKKVRRWTQAQKDLNLLLQ